MALTSAMRSSHAFSSSGVSVTTNNLAGTVYVSGGSAAADYGWYRRNILKPEKQADSGVWKKRITIGGILNILWYAEESMAAAAKSNIALANAPGRVGERRRAMKELSENVVTANKETFSGSC